MDNTRIIELLTSLMQLDLEMSEVYDESIPHVADPDTRARLTRFREDHRRHIVDISGIFGTLGSQPPGLTALQPSTIIRGSSGGRGTAPGILETLTAAESFAARSYGDAILHELPVEIQDRLGAIYEEEQRHLDYFESLLGAPAGAASH